MGLQANTSVGKNTFRQRGMADVNETFLDGKGAVRVVGTADYFEPTYINQGLQKKRFIKTGPFFYSLKPKELAPRNRTGRPDFERKLAYVAPEERALMPQSMDEHALKEAMGLLE